MDAFSVWFYRDNENREGCRMKNNQEKANEKMNISNFLSLIFQKDYKRVMIVLRVRKKGDK